MFTILKDLTSLRKKSWQDVSTPEKLWQSKRKEFHILRIASGGSLKNFIFKRNVKGI